jgi:DNA repair exonuclease SbcCD nuclease subunit
MHELKTNLKNVEKVYHLADIHIRNVKRHTEYSLVFENFYKQVKKDNYDNAIIFIGGDIAHAKTEMSPELIHQISSFLRECSKLHPTIVIAGNHDCNLNNPDRLDVLSPIMDMMDDDNLFYLKNSGLYKIGDVAFGVFSILDDPENYISGLDINDPSIKTKIAVYHGAVKRSMTDIGYVVMGGDIELPMFNGYDIVMLGDIHKHQVLQEYQSEHKFIPEDKVDEYKLKGWCLADD